MKALPESFSVYNPRGWRCGELRAVGREEGIASDLEGLMGVGGGVAGVVLMVRGEAVVVGVRVRGIEGVRRHGGGN